MASDIYRSSRFYIYLNTIDYFNIDRAYQIFAFVFNILCSFVDKKDLDETFVFSLW